MYTGNFKSAKLELQKQNEWTAGRFSKAKAVLVRHRNQTRITEAVVILVWPSAPNFRLLSIQNVYFWEKKINPPGSDDLRKNFLESHDDWPPNELFKAQQKYSKNDFSVRAVGIYFSVLHI